MIDTTIIVVVAAEAENEQITGKIAKIGAGSVTKTIRVIMDLVNLDTGLYIPQMHLKCCRSGHEREERASWQEKEQRHQDSPSSPTNTVIIRGLLPNTTEPALYAALSAYSPKHIRLIARAR